MAAVDSQSTAAVIAQLFLPHCFFPRFSLSNARCLNGSLSPPSDTALAVHISRRMGF